MEIGYLIKSKFEFKSNLNQILDHDQDSKNPPINIGESLFRFYTKISRSTLKFSQNRALPVTANRCRAVPDVPLFAAESCRGGPQFPAERCRSMLRTTTRDMPIHVENHSARSADPRRDRTRAICRTPPRPVHRQCQPCPQFSAEHHRAGSAKPAECRRRDIATEVL